MNDEGIFVPPEIQDILERNIRTLSNSISNSMSKQPVQHDSESSMDIFDFHKNWLTTTEFLFKNERFTHAQNDTLSPKRQKPQEEEKKEKA